MTGATWHSGNAAIDGRDTRGWILGHFIDAAEGVRHSADVEVKWFHHPAGDQRTDWTTDDQRTTLLLLISGRFRLDLTAASVTLAEQGDYVLWGPGIDHSWHALADTVILTVRWPSIS